jgi:hopanoid biosynthesis associated protein HpnK
VRKSLPLHSRRYLVAVADDFGISSSVNRAVAEAHDAGVLTAASLMAGGNDFEEAVRIAAERLHLAVGLHVTLCDGRAVLPSSRIPGLVGPDGRFEKSPVRAWFKYARREMLSQIEMEVEAQIERLEASGIHPSHVDCHHHLHMKPAIFEILCRVAARRSIRWIRIPGESLRQVVSIFSLSRGAMPFLEWIVFGILGLANKKTAKEHSLRVVSRTYGLSRTGRVDEKYFLDILNLMNRPLNEIFTHPDLSTDAGRRELEALTSQRVRERIVSLGMTLAGYRELTEGVPAFSSAWGRS